MADEHRQNNGNGIKVAIEWLRLVTPALVAINLFIMAAMNTHIGNIDNKLFKHMTNHEMHVLKSDTVNTATFDMHCQLQSETLGRILNSLDRLRSDLVTKAK